MGSPELPGDPGDDDVRATQAHVQHAPMPNDDSDNEPNDAYEGYQPLAMGDDGVESTVDTNLMDDEPTSGATINEAMLEPEPDPNLPHVESVDVEIERQVWSEPRPKELQLELDNARATQIINAMANFTLPNAVVPEWAAGVPEERWKEELLQRIRQRSDTRSSVQSELQLTHGAATQGNT